MPFYEYQCSSCGHLLEAMQKITDAPLRKCPECGRSTLKKLLSAPVFRLKGSGWYETDFKSDKEQKRNLVDEGKGEEKKEEPKAAPEAAKAETKAETKAESTSGSAAKSATEAKGPAKATGGTPARARAKPRAGARTKAGAKAVRKGRR